MSAPSRSASPREYTAVLAQPAEVPTAELLNRVDVRVAALIARVRALAAESESAKQHAHDADGAGVLPLFPEIHAAASRPSAEAADVHCEFPPSATVSPDRLRIQMSYAGLTKAAFSEVFGVPAEAIQSWLAGERVIPAWVLPAVYIFELLSPSERNSLLRPSAARSARNPAKVHPFARIEEL